MTAFVVTPEPPATPERPERTAMLLVRLGDYIARWDWDPDGAVWVCGRVELFATLRDRSLRLGDPAAR